LKTGWIGSLASDGVILAVARGRVWFTFAHKNSSLVAGWIRWVNRDRVWEQLEAAMDAENIISWCSKYQTGIQIPNVQVKIKPGLRVDKSEL